MRIGAAGFDWDSGNWPKCGKHGLSQADIESLFEAEPAVYPDVAHSHDEQRKLAIGTVSTGRYVLVAFTLRQTDDGTQIRPVSARLDAVKARSQARGIPYQRFIREAIERALSERNP